MYSQKQIGYIFVSFIIVLITIVSLSAISIELTGIALFFASWYCVYLSAGDFEERADGAEDFSCGGRRRRVTAFGSAGDFEIEDAVKADDHAEAGEELGMIGGRHLKALNRKSHWDRGMVSSTSASHH